MKMRGYGWAGYQHRPALPAFLGRRAAAGNKKPTLASRIRALKVKGDRAIRREHYMDCGRRGAPELDDVVERHPARSSPRCSSATARPSPTWPAMWWRATCATGTPIPVICGAERLYPSRPRRSLEQAFGPAVFETYGCREVMLIGAECEAHAGLHVSMENAGRRGGRARTRQTGSPLREAGRDSARW